MYNANIQLVKWGGGKFKIQFNPLDALFVFHGALNLGLVKCA